MSRLRRLSLRPQLSFPRVSGDEPLMTWLPIPKVKFSPRERG